MLSRFNSIAKQLITLKELDLATRERLVQSAELFDGYNTEMEAVHLANAEALDEIIEAIGYPTTAKVGQEASEAAWLIVQHAISAPHFMKKCLVLMEEAVSESNTAPRHLAYLTDRIATFEGKPQHYGTSFDWDKNGQLSPSPYDSLERVNIRRAAIGLNTIEEQTQLIRDRANKEGQEAPVDAEKRREQYDKWRRKVGWIH